MSAIVAPPGATRLAYLISQYPSLSMIWALREVRMLREMGLGIEVASINRPDRALQALAGEEAEEVQGTYYVKAHGVAGAARAHATALVTQPRGYLDGLGLALRLGGLDLRRLFMNLMYFTEALMVGAWMKRRGFSHLHVHLGSQAATVGMLVKRVFGFGLSITVHGPDEFYDAPGQYLGEKIAAADFICCISHFARSQLMKLSPYAHWAKLLVVRLGVDAEAFAPTPRRGAANRFEVVCVGRLTPAKGQHLLIDAVARIARGGGRIRLRLVGGGPDEASLRAHVARLDAAGCVELTGPVNPDRIGEVYADADAFCLPSFAEGIPVVLMEAMSSGLACISTRVAGIPELIRDEIDGLLVAPSDVDGLVAALRRLMDDEPLRRRMGDSGRARVHELYHQQRNVASLAAVFRERVGGRAPPIAAAGLALRDRT